MEIRIDEAALTAHIAKRLDPLLNKAAHLVRNQAVTKLKGARRGSIGDTRTVLGEGEPPHTGLTGNLAKSVIVRKHPTNPFARQVGTPLFYGLVQEVGAPGTSPGGETVKAVRPVHGRYMAIPWSSEAQKHAGNGGSSRTFQPKSGAKLRTVPLKRTEGFMLVEETPGRGKKARLGAKNIIHYIFLTHVTIKKHPWLLPSLREVEPQILALFQGGSG